MFRKNGLRFNWETLVATFLTVLAPSLSSWANNQVAQSQAHHGAVTGGYIASLVILGLLSGLLHSKALATPPESTSVIIPPGKGASN